MMIANRINRLLIIVFLPTLLFFICSFKAFAQTQREIDDESIVISNSLKDNWFVEAGLDMTLQNVYSQDISKVFPRGKTFGVNAAIGKFFAPEVGLRVRVNWDNGIGLLSNDHLEWLDKGDYDSNSKGGGFATAQLDVLFNLKNIFGDYSSDRKWDVFVFPRAGLGSNLAIGSLSPIVGGGFACSYKIKEGMSIFADLGYQAITSEAYGGVGGGTGMSVKTGANGFMDVHAGVKWELGKTNGRFLKVKEY